MNAFDFAQLNYDHMVPSEEYCPYCGREASVDCICTGEVIDEEDDI